MFSKTLILTHVIVLGLIACAAEQPMNPDLAQAIVANAWQADQHIVWELDWPAAPVGGPLTVETWRAGNRYRFEILEAVAPTLIGETLVFDGQTAWQFNRFSGEPPLSLDVPYLSPVMEAMVVIDKLMTTPPQTATQELAQTIHGSAQKVTLSFANGEQLAFWRDDKTGLPVRVMFLVGGKAARLEARSFEVLVDPPRALFELEEDD
jgi:hypothetical protein